MEQSGIFYIPCYALLNLDNYDLHRKRCRYCYCKTYGKDRNAYNRHFDGFIILAQSERDFEGKRNRIMRGDVFGFYTVERAKNLN